MANRVEIEKTWYSLYEEAKYLLSRQHISSRVIENHAIVLAFHWITSDILGVYHELLPYIEKIALKKHRTCTGREETLADQFFNILQNPSMDLPGIAIDRDASTSKLYINLPEVQKSIRDNGYPFSPNDTSFLTSLSQHPAFLDNKRHYFIDNKGEKHQLRAWVFDLGKIDAD